MDPATLFVYALAALYGLDKVVSALGRLGKLPGGLARWDQERAERIVAAEDRDAKLDRIIAEFETNHGTTLRDAINRIEVKLDAHLAEDAPLVEEHRELVQRVARLERSTGA